MENVQKCIIDNNPDILLFQELIPPATKYIPKEYKKVGFSIHHSIYSKEKPKRHKFRLRYDYADFSWGRVINVHLSLDLEKRLKDVKKIDNLVKGLTIVGGDFNSKVDFSNYYQIDQNPITYTNPKGVEGKVDHFFSTKREGIVRVVGEKREWFYYKDKVLSDHSGLILLITPSNSSSSVWSRG